MNLRARSFPILPPVSSYHKVLRYSSFKSETLTLAGIEWIISVATSMSRGRHSRSLDGFAKVYCTNHSRYRLRDSTPSNENPIQHLSTIVIFGLQLLVLLRYVFFLFPRNPEKRVLRSNLVTTEEMQCKQNCWTFLCKFLELFKFDHITDA